MPTDPKPFEIIPLSRLKLDKANPRVHTQEGLRLLEMSVDEGGPLRSGVADEELRVLAGNATLKTLRRKGIDKALVVDTNKDEWLVVQRDGFTDEQKVRLALLDNRSGEFSFWDAEQLQVLVDSGQLAGILTRNELEQFMTGWSEEPADGDAIDDYSPEMETLTIKIANVKPEDHQSILTLCNRVIGELQMPYEAE